MEAMVGLGIGCIVLALILFIFEALTPGFFLAIPATMFLVIGALVLITPDINPWILLLIAMAAIVISFIVTLKIYKSIAPPAPPETSSGGSLIGKTGMVTTKVIPDRIKGKVRVENQSWSATSKVVIPIDTRVKIINMEGVHLVVEKFKEE